MTSCVLEIELYNLLICFLSALESKAVLRVDFISFLSFLSAIVPPGSYIPAKKKWPNNFSLYFQVIWEYTPPRWGLGREGSGE